MAGNNVFAVPVFLVVFRESLETVIIVSVLLAFLKQTLDGPNRDRAVYKALVKQVRLKHLIFIIDDKHKGTNPRIPRYGSVLG